MTIGWKILLPIVLGFFILVFGILIILNCGPKFNTILFI
jgi:hypothetical protein